ncbi:hypothetical protein NDU88_003398 [Pleurodeles waltl]|uniref:Uncharacterized protein n=1 Tax=Pleurodeles waltl TaxID=8319 RepID=A0AAV7TPP1_PLEWA|nr:hypothetical protein NDU88_003398 [Pleurodeles waltl]
MCTLKKALRITMWEEVNPELNFHSFLREYRVTPHCTTKQALLSFMLTGTRRHTMPPVPVGNHLNTARADSNETERDKRPGKQEETCVDLAPTNP